jgi:hypothetical protein
MVVDLASRRASRDANEPGCCRSCDSEWFVLRRRPADPDIAEHGAVTLSHDGRVTGFIGEPVCAECGVTWNPAAGWRYL